jgi:hypothetical protein
MFIAFCLHTVIFTYTYPNIVVNWADPDPKLASEQLTNYYGIVGGYLQL